ncbi:MAG: leucyl aminopeptidase family protein, partial [Pseudomonadota bacterium]
MIDPFIYGGKETAIPLTLVSTGNYTRFFNKLSEAQQQWVERNGFTGKSGQLLAVPAGNGDIERVCVGVCNLDNFYAIADLPARLPAGVYGLEGTGVRARLESLAIGWGLGCYQFDRYKKQKAIEARLKLPNSCNHPRIQGMVAASSRVRDLINTPAENMMPQHLSAVVAELAQTYAGTFDEIVGDDLLTENYPC